MHWTSSDALDVVQSWSDGATTKEGKAERERAEGNTFLIVSYKRCKDTRESVKKSLSEMASTDSSSCDSPTRRGPGPPFLKCPQQHQGSDAGCCETKVGLC